MTTTDDPLDEVGPLLDAVLEADRENTALFSSERLNEVVAKFIEVAHANGLEAAVAASAIGERLVGAMLLESTSLRAWKAGDREVLIVDGAVVTDLGLRTKAAHLTALGVEVAHGAVVRLLANEDRDEIAPLRSLTTLPS